MSYIYYKDSVMVENESNTRYTIKKEFQHGFEKYAAFDNMIEGVQVVTFEWRYFYANESLAKMGLTTIQEMMGNTMMDIYPGFEKTEIFQSLKKSMDERIPVATVTEFKFPDGSTGWFEVSAQPVLEGILILSTDITKLMRTEAELKRKLAERTEMINQISKQKQQLEEFCQIIAHNLRAPLSNLLQLSEMINNSEKQEEKLNYLKIQKTVLDTLQQTFEELVDITKTTMDFAVKRQEIDLNQEIKLILKSLSNEVKAFKADISFDFSDIATLTYPKKYIRSIITNLLSNAIKYSSPDRPPKIRISSKIKDGWICIEVKDNGLGIDLKKHKKSLFKLHKTFHNHPDSKGFGLFLIKTQVEALGGSINVKSKINKGSTFSVILYKERPQ
ncbi:ATP-binding protein [Flavobacterium pedocola]